MSKKEKNTNSTGIMMGAIILMVVIVFVVFIVFFVNTAKNGSRISQVYSNSLAANNVDVNEVNNINDVNNVNTNEVEYIEINNTVEDNNSVDLPQNTENEKYKYDKSYLGKYTWKDGDNSISFELTDDNGQLKYTLSYYPNGVGHASEELRGNWSTSSNMVSVDNENSDAIATYSFSDIKYVKKNIEINIQATSVLNEQLEMYKIPDGKYTFKRVD